MVRLSATEGSESGSLAVLMDVETPFKDGASASEQAVLDWLGTVTKRNPDIILLDYGYEVSLPIPGPETHERPVLQSLKHQFLLIAAGGNLSLNSEGRPADEDRDVSAPGVYPEVLAVGPLNGDGALQSYAEWTPEIRKPDLFMKDQLLGTPLQEALKGDVFAAARLAAWAGNARLDLLRAARRGRCRAGLVDGSGPDANRAEGTAAGGGAADPARLEAIADGARDSRCRGRSPGGVDPPSTVRRPVLAADGVSHHGSEPTGGVRHARGHDTRRLARGAADDARQARTIRVDRAQLDCLGAEIFW